MNEAMIELVEAIKGASPMIWEAAKQGIQADLAIAHTMMWFFGCGLGLSIVVTILCFFWNDYSGGSEILCFLYPDYSGGSEILCFLYPDYSGGSEILGFISGVFSLFAIVVLLINYVTIKQLTLAPDWYTIKKVAELLPG